ncbi:unnamed protein product [Caenorhabditis sp. 36 PRJEB53466]|nr:unnamed protein product [Caenorhabditis sp. 36 PRJEB53466]
MDPNSLASRKPLVGCVEQLQDAVVADLTELIGQLTERLAASDAAIQAVKKAQKKQKHVISQLKEELARVGVKKDQNAEKASSLASPDTSIDAVGFGESASTVNAEKSCPPTAQLAADFLERMQTDFARLVTNLAEPSVQVQNARTELSQCKKEDKETLAEYYNRVKRIANTAFPGSADSFVDKTTMDSFVNGLDTEMSVYVRGEEPGTIGQAYKLALVKEMENTYQLRKGPSRTRTEVLPFSIISIPFKPITSKPSAMMRQLAAKGRFDVKVLWETLIPPHSDQLVRCQVPAAVGLDIIVHAAVHNGLVIGGMNFDANQLMEIRITNPSGLNKVLSAGETIAKASELEKYDSSNEL